MAPTTRRPWTSANRPPATMPIAAGVLVNRMNAVMRAAEKPRSCRRKSFWNWNAGDGEQGDEESGAGEQPKAASVRPERWFCVLALEPAALRQSAGDDGDQREAERAGRVDPSPAAVPVSASGSTHTHMPAPSAPAIVMRLKAYARDPRGISSAETIPISTPSAPAVADRGELDRASGRRGSAPTHRATRTRMHPAAHDDDRSRDGRPGRRRRRAASATSTPARTVASTVPWSPRDAPNSSATYVTVWVSSVPT